MQNINNPLRDPFVLLNAAQSFLFYGGVWWAKLSSNSLTVRISCSNLKWHIDVKSTFSILASLWAFTGHSVKVTDIAYSCPGFMFLNFSFYYPAIAGLFYESILTSLLKDARLSGQQKVCVPSRLSLY